MAGSSRASAGQPTAAAGIEGVVAAREGAVLLPGATVVLVDTAGTPVATVLTDAAGVFRLDDLLADVYRLVVTLEGFQSYERTIEVSAGGAADVKVELELAGLSETVTVVPPPTSNVATSGPLAGTAMLGAATLQELPTSRDGLTASLAMLGGVIQAPRGLSIRGARPDQSGLQIGVATVADPSTGTAEVRLPVDAVSSVEVLPNPYAVEYGRFSSGVTVIEPRVGGDEWHVRLNNFIPSLRPKRDALIAVHGVERFGPQFLAAGPLISDRLFLSQSAEFRYEALDVPSRPEDEVTTSRSLNSFTRLDAPLSPVHRLTGSVHVYPQRRSAVNLDTFTPPEVAADTRPDTRDIIVSDRAVLTNATLLSSTFHVNRSSVGVGDIGGPGGMVIRPDGKQGRHFNVQQRESTTYQWVQSLSHLVEGGPGDHLIKVGFDALHTTFSGTSRSAPVSVLRADGTLARRLTYGGGTAQRAESTDVAGFLQDTWRLPGHRLVLDAGTRVDRDGLLSRTNFTWRAGAAMALDRAGTRTLRGGAGLFFERTPSIVGTFRQFEVTTDTRFEADGRTPSAPPVTRPHVVPTALETPRSLLWNVGYDHQLGGGRFVRVGYLSRTGSRELVVQPRDTAAGPVLALTSDGRSRYRDLELGVGTPVGSTVNLEVSYIRSMSEADLNSYLSFFGTLREPIISTNAFAAAPADAPHRVVSRIRVAPTRQWLVNAFVEYRSGLPYSPVDETLEFAGPRNQTRFPAYTLLDLLVERRVNLFGFSPWIGIRAYNALDAFNPVDVQANVTATDFGQFYNAQPRRVRLQLRFE